MREIASPASGFATSFIRHDPNLEDQDAATYLNAVAVADGQGLEAGVRAAVNAFVLGLKADGLWSKMEACCILAGARTLSGALVPLRGPAPTNVNFVAGDYDRETGLKGDAATTYLDTNYSNSQTDGQNDKHAAVWVTEALSNTGGVSLFGSGTPAGNTYMRANLTTPTSMQMMICGASATLVTSAAQSTGFIGLNRAASAEFVRRFSSTDTTVAVASNTQVEANMRVHMSGTVGRGDARIAFYSFGRSITLGDLEGRLSTLITDLGTAIA